MVVAVVVVAGGVSCSLATVPKTTQSMGSSNFCSPAPHNFKRSLPFRPPPRCPDSPHLRTLAPLQHSQTPVASRP